MRKHRPSTSTNCALETAPFICGHLPPLLQHAITYIAQYLKLFISAVGIEKGSQDK
jgi:hypothetical protein